MKNLESIIAKVSITLLLIFLIAACNDNSSLTEPTLSDQDQILKAIEEDDVIQSFEANYNEEEAMEFATEGLAKAIYPIRVGKGMILVNKEIDIRTEGDTSYAFVTKTFQGILFIAGSLEELPEYNILDVDTVIQKDFTTTVTRNVVLVKNQNTERSDREWKVYSVSLAEGGVLSDNIDIKKLTIYLPNGEEIVIDSPNDYYLTRTPGMKRQLPTIGRGEDVTLRVEVKSKYEEDDFVTLTWGALKTAKHHRSKRMFKLISSEFDGQYYNKVYENTWRANYWAGYKHAIINAMPKQVIYDTETEVETSSWGIPYYVK